MTATRSKRLAASCACIMAVWLADAHLHRAVADDYRVQRGVSLNARSGPGTGYAAVERLPEGAVVSELERRGSWSRVRLDNGAEVWVHNGYLEIEAASVEVVPQLGHASRVTGIFVDNTAGFLITGAYDNADAIVWDTATGSIIRRLEGIGEIIRYDPGERVAIANELDVDTWSVETGEKIAGKQMQWWDTPFNTAINPARDILAAGSLCASVRLMSTVTGRRFALSEAMNRTKCDDALESTRHIRFSGDGRRLFAANSDGLFGVWDLDEGREPELRDPFVFRLESVRDDVSLGLVGDAVALTTDADRAVVGWQYGTTTFIDLTTGEVLWTYRENPSDTPYRDEHVDTASAAAVAPSGETIAIGYTDGALAVLDAADGTVLHDLTSARGRATAMAFDPSGEARLFVGYADGTVVLWSLDPLAEVRSFGGLKQVAVATTHPLEDRLVAGLDDGEMIEWDLRDGTVAVTRQPVDRMVQSLAYADDGTRILAAFGDRTVRQFDAETWEENLRIDTDLPPGKAAYGPSGETIAVIVATRDPLAPVFEVDGDLGKLVKYDATSGKVLLTFDYPRSGFNNNRMPLNDFEIDPRGEYVVAGAGMPVEDNTAHNIVFDWETGETVRHEGGGQSVTVATGFSSDGAYRLFETWHGNSNETEVVVEDRSGNRVASLANDGYLNYGVTTFVPQTNTILFAAASGDLMKASIDDEQAAPFLVGHRGYVHDVTVDRRKGIIVTASQDGTTRIWDLVTGKERVALVVFPGGDWMAYTPEGFFNGSAGAHKRVAVIGGGQVLPIESFFDALYRPDLVQQAIVGDPEGRVREAAEKLDLASLWDSGLPPQVAFAAGDGTTTDSDRFAVDLALTARSGDIGRVEIRVNGATQYADNAPVAAAAENERRELSVPVFLTPGRNLIEAVVYNRANLIASQPVSITVESTAPLGEKPTLHVLAVGVNRYADERIIPLNYAVDDARAIADALVKAGSGVYEHVAVRAVFDEDATPENLALVFEEMRETVKPQDVFVFFLAGHGMTIDGRYYFIHPALIADGLEGITENGIDQTMWQRWFASVPAQKSLLLYDTCESGTLTREEALGRAELTAAVDRLTRATGRTVMTATTDTDAALEGYGGHGVFTFTVLEGVGGADADRDAQLEVTELVDYVSEQLPEISEQIFNHRQVPQASVSGASFTLGRPTIVLDLSEE